MSKLTMSKSIRIGSRVRLTCGGPVMTILGNSGKDGEWDVAWWSGDKLETSEFMPGEAFVLAEPEIDLLGLVGDLRDALDAAFSCVDESNAKILAGKVDAALERADRILGRSKV